MNTTFATSSMIGHQCDAAYRPAAAGLDIPAYLRGLNSWARQSALHRSGQRARVAAGSPSG